MNEFIEYYLDNMKVPSKSAGTIRTMECNMKRLQIFLEKPIEKFKEDDFKDSSGILDKIRKNYSLSTTTSTCEAIIKFLEYKDASQDLIKKYVADLISLKKERVANDEAQKKTPLEEECWISFPDMKKRVEEVAKEFFVKSHSFLQFRSFLCLSLFTLQPPARLGNYLKMIVLRDFPIEEAKEMSNDFNYILIDDDEYHFIWNNYKTSRSVGQVIYTVENPTLSTILNIWFNRYNKSDEFLVDSDGKSFTQPKFSQTLATITRQTFDKEFKLNTIRHIFLTWFLSQNPTIEDKKKVLKIVGHKYNASTTEKYARFD